MADKSHPMTIGQAFQSWRMDHDMSQTEVAESIDRSYDAIHRLEAGKISQDNVEEHHVTRAVLAAGEGLDDFMRHWWIR